MKKIVVFLSVFALLICDSTSVFAYNLLPVKWSNAKPVNWYYDNYVSAASQTAANNGAAAWNNVNYSKVSFSKVTGSKVLFSEVVDTTTDNDGWSIIHPGSGPISNATIVINKAVTDTYNNASALKSVAVHEFGHVLGLDHTTGAVIMNPYTWGKTGRYGNYNLTTPQTDDINGIKAIYP